MDWIETPESSNIARFTYNESSSILIVDFNKGGAYQYFDVPSNIFEGMRVASSKGQYLAQNIKGSFRYAKM